MGFDKVVKVTAVSQAQEAAGSKPGSCIRLSSCFLFCF